MDKPTDYIRGGKRLQIINKWLRGIEDDIYEVLPTKKEGKYIVKKRAEPIAKPKEEPKEESKEESKEEPKEEPSEDEETVEDEVEIVNEEDEEEPEIIHKATPMHRCLKCNFINDPTYINYQILSQLQELNDYLKKEQARKEQKKLIKDTIADALKDLYKASNNEISRNSIITEEQYNKPIELPAKRRNNVFADVDY